MALRMIAGMSLGVYCSTLVVVRFPDFALTLHSQIIQGLLGAAKSPPSCSSSTLLNLPDALKLPNISVACSLVIFLSFCFLSPYCDDELNQLRIASQLLNDRLATIRPHPASNNNPS